MAKKRKHHRRRSHNPHRRHRSNPRRHHRHSLMLMGHRRHHRRRNPSLRGLTGGLIPLSIGAGVGYFGSRMIPSSIPFLQPYNTGPTGFLLNLGSGYALYALAGLTNATRRFRPGILVGTVIAVAVRAYETYAMPAAPISAPAAAVSGDLGYYVSDRFPFPQGAGGPSIHLSGRRLLRLRLSRQPPRRVYVLARLPRRLRSHQARREGEELTDLRCKSKPSVGAAFGVRRSVAILAANVMDIRSFAALTK